MNKNSSKNTNSKNTNSKGRNELKFAGWINDCAVLPHKEQVRNELTSAGKTNDRENELIWQAKNKAERPMRMARGREFCKQREAAGISLTRMAKLTGLSITTVSRFEDGEYIQRPKAMTKLLFNTLRLHQTQAFIKAAKQAFPENFNSLLPLDGAGF